MSVKDNMNSVTDLFTKGVERFGALGELHLKAGEKMAARQMDAMNLYLEQGARLVQLASESKGYGDLYRAQVELSRELGERLLEESRTNVRLAGELRDDYRGWVDGLMSDLREGKEAVREAITA